MALCFRVNSYLPAIILLVSIVTLGFIVFVARLVHCGLVSS